MNQEYFIENEKRIPKNILTDEIKLKQVIVNLISNAIKYTEKGKVTFGYQINEKDKTIEFSVKDTGLGIDEENLKVIYFLSLIFFYILLNLLLSFEFLFFLFSLSIDSMTE